MARWTSWINWQRSTDLSRSSDQRKIIEHGPFNCEHLKHDGTLPIIGVNTFLNPNPQTDKTTLELARSSDDEKHDQLKRLKAFHDKNKNDAPAALQKLREACINNGNIFAELMNAARVCSLGQITHTLFEVGGQYRRNM